MNSMGVFGLWYSAVILFIKWLGKLWMYLTFGSDVERSTKRRRLKVLSPGQDKPKSLT